MAEPLPIVLLAEDETAISRLLQDLTEETDYAAAGRFHREERLLQYRAVQKGLPLEDGSDAAHMERFLQPFVSLLSRCLVQGRKMGRYPNPGYYRPGCFPQPEFENVSGQNP